MIFLEKILAFKNKETEINYESVILYKSEFHDTSGGLEDSE